MNFQKKYYYMFKDLTNSLYTIEIWQDTLTAITAIEVKGAEEPFVIEYAILDNKITPVHGSGATLTMIAKVGNTFVDLYTGKIQEYMAKCYKGNNLVWVGYLDSELYNSPFSILNNYPVTFTCSDGMAILDRINYVDSGKVPYTGIDSQWTVITNILTKLNLPINDIRVGVSTTCVNFTPSSIETIFHKTLIINDNYINETGEPETCRKVLEGILAPYGAFIIQCNGSIYITDLNFVAQKNNQYFRAYNGTTYTNIPDVLVNLNIGDLSAIGFASDTSNLNMASAVNKVVVKYSNYRNKASVDYSATDFTIPGTATTKGETNYQWTQTENSTSASWTKYNNGRFINLIGVTPQTDADSYLSTTATTNKDLMVNKSFSYTKELPYLIPAKSYKLKISMSAYFRTTDNLNKTDDGTKKVIHAGRVMMKLKIGNQFLKSKQLDDLSHNSINATGASSITNKWVNVDDLICNDNFGAYFYSPTGTSIRSYNYSDIADQWVDFKDAYFDFKGLQQNDYLVNLYEEISGSPSFGGGAITLDIYDAMTWTYDTTFHGFVAAGSYLKEVRIKDIKLTIVNADGTDLSDNDIEYFSVMDADYKEEQSIEIIHGTNVSKCPVDRGSLLFKAGTQFDFCTGWTRAGNNNQILENLLQGTVKSNYLKPSVVLTCATKRLPILVGCVTYANHLPGINMMVTSAKIALRNNITDLTLNEVSQDVLTIVSA